MVASPTGTGNRVVRCDALEFAESLPAASIDLVYVDPPYFTGRDQTSRGQTTFSDRWEDIESYLAWLMPRIGAIHPLLKPTGSLYVHLDWHAVHYVKVELDKLFGYDHFLNEIVWLYGLGGSSPNYWPRKHDNILWYARERGGHFFEAARVPARSQRMRGQTKKAPDWWDIPAINNMSRERLGYPTQKPEALLQRIVESSCPAGGVVADFFCGSGTALAVAKKTGRGFVGCDTSEDAIRVASERLSQMTT